MQTLHDLYVAQLKDLYDAEQRMVDALPDLIKAAKNKSLREAITGHLTETKDQVMRLETIFEAHNIKAKSETCKAMKGLLAECDSELKKWKESSVRDASLISNAQRIEHYEIAGYGTAACFAQLLGYKSDARLLLETLKEEKDADKRLSEIAILDVDLAALGPTKKNSYYEDYPFS